MKLVSRNFIEGAALVLEGWGSARAYQVELPKDLRNLDHRSDHENLRNDVREVSRDMRKAADKVSEIYSV